MLEEYEDREKWMKMSLVNIAKAGFFSSDRTIAQYNEEIWKLKNADEAEDKGEEQCQSQLTWNAITRSTGMRWP